VKGGGEVRLGGGSAVIVSWIVVPQSSLITEQGPLRVEFKK
jgi:hypothetical protein